MDERTVLHRTPTGTVPARLFEVDLSPNTDREIRQLNAEEFIIQNIDAASTMPGNTTQDTPHHLMGNGVPVPLPDVSNLFDRSASGGSSLATSSRSGHIGMKAPTRTRDTKAVPTWQPVVNPGRPVSGRPPLPPEAKWKQKYTPWGLDLATPTMSASATVGTTYPSTQGQHIPLAGAAGVSPQTHETLASHHASPIGASSASSADFALRQDAADARAHELEHRLTAMTSTLHEHSTDNTTVLREFMTYMRDAATLATQLAAEAATAQASAADLAHTRLATLIQSSVSDNETALAADRLETLAALDELRVRADNNERDSNSAWTDLSESIRLLREAPRVQWTSTPEPPGVLAIDQGSQQPASDGPNAATQITSD